MAYWLRKLLIRLAGGNMEHHGLRVEFNKIPGQSAEDRAAMMREVGAEIAKDVSAGNSQESTRAALDEIAQRYGTTVKRFEEH
jgi:hypothetical protein